MIRICGKHNRVKTDVMVTLYNFTVWKGSEGLTARELAFHSGTRVAYCWDRLALYAGKIPYPLTGGYWRKRLVVREKRDGEVRDERIGEEVRRYGIKRFIYRLSADGRRWCEDWLPREEFLATAKRLKPLWERVVCKGGE